MYKLCVFFISTGMIYDLSGNYASSLYLGGAALFLAGALVIGVRWTDPGDQNMQENSPADKMDIEVDITSKS